MSDKPEGLVIKYNVTRLNDVEGKHISCEYFVLDITHDPRARKAARFYASLVEQEEPQLAQDLYDLIFTEAVAEAKRNKEEVE